MQHVGEPNTVFKSYIYVNIFPSYKFKHNTYSLTEFVVQTFRPYKYVWVSYMKFVNNEFICKACGNFYLFYDLITEVGTLLGP
jgi:hypothetical protein